MSEFATDHEQKTRLLAEIRRLEAELAAARALKTALDEIDRTPVGAYGVTWSNMPEPCESCVEMREIAEKALKEYSAVTKAKP